MERWSELAVQTCRRMTVAQLRAVCRARGWSPPAAKKDGLVAFVAPRLLEPAGAARAMAALPGPWLRLLHRIALGGGSLKLEHASAFLGTARPSRGVVSRERMRDIAQNLLTSGVVLVQERGVQFRSGRKGPDLVLHLPDVHREKLPPFPVATRPLGPRPKQSDPVAFFRDVLRIAGMDGTDGTDGGEAAGRTPAARLAAAVSLGEGPLQVGGHEVLDLEAFLEQARRISCRVGDRRQVAARQAALYVLGHLPEGEGVGSEALGAALATIGRKFAAADLEQFLDDAVAAGFVQRGGEGGAPCHRLADGTAPSSEEPSITLERTPEGVRVDVARSGPDPLLGLASVGRSRATRNTVHIAPDPVLLGRRGDRLDDVPGLATARERSPAWEKAAAQAEARHGTLTLHSGLLVLSVDDEGLEAVLASRLGDDVRALTSGTLAVPSTLLERVEKLVKQQGYGLRRRP